jgi:2-keto-3-deoxy-galactonokinase
MATLPGRNCNWTPVNQQRISGFAVNMIGRIWRLRDVEIGKHHQET